MSEINIENTDFEKSNITFIDGLTLEKIRIKYNWLLNAKVKDAVIGENDKGIVWYFGDWICGDWMDGTWYNGNFISGNWYNGNFYSYNINKFEVLSNSFFIHEINNKYSRFTGTWYNGFFFSGTFGKDDIEDWEGYEYKIIDDKPIFEKDDEIIGGFVKTIKKNLPLWLNGIFKTGIFKNSIWTIGDFFDGQFINSQWIDGKWYNGIFEGHSWYNGQWYNGEFIKGNWYNGIFTKLKKDLKSYFGSSDKGYICEWFNGTFKNGEFFSNINSDINNLSLWYDGIFENGIWNSGHFISGEWKNGLWKNGVFGYKSYNTSNINPNYVYQDDNVLNTAYWSGNTNNVILSDVLVNNITSDTYTWEYFNYEKLFDIDSIVNNNSFNIAGNYEKYINLINDTYKIYTVDSSGTETERTLSLLTYNSGNNTTTFLFSDADTNVDITYKMKLIIRRPVVMILNHNYLYHYMTGTTKLTGGYFTIETDCSLYNLNDYIYIDEYSESYRITNIHFTGGFYYLRINKSFSESQSVKFLRKDIYDERNNTSNKLVFHEFNFDFSIIDDTFITGIEVNANIEIINNIFSGSFNNLKMILPLKNLNFIGFDSSNNPVYSADDLCDYPDIYRTNPEYPYIKGYKIDSDIINIDKNIIFGNDRDIWELKDLEKYYSNDIDYQVSNINSFKDNIRIALNISLNSAIDSTFKISNISIKAYYSDNSTIVKWYNGTFEKGTWLNGNFYDGKIGAMNMIKGNIYDGEIGNER